MHRKPDGTNHPGTNANNNKPETVRAQPWWCSSRQDSIITDVLGESRTSLSLSEHLNDGLGTKTSESMSRVGTDRFFFYEKMEKVAMNNRMYIIDHTIPVIRPTMSDHVPPPTQMMLVGHSFACPSYPYADPYYGGVVPPYVPQSLVHSHSIGVHPGRMPLPLEMTEEPVYVNAKQYHGIMRRRQSRAKAELERKPIKVRKTYRHESRHLHARARGCGGRFLNTKKLGSNASIAATDKSSDSSLSREATETELQGTNTQQSFSNLYYPHNQGFHLSPFRSLSDKALEGGDRPCHHRALTIK